MKANELCVGDWVQTRACTIQGEERLSPPMRVCSLGEDWVCTRIDPEQGDPFEDKIEDVRPIPLTPNILIENGFIVVVETPSYTVLQLVLNAYNDGCFVRIYKNIQEVDIDYNPCDAANGGINFTRPLGLSVHEFQHILRIAGIEKEIEL